MSKDLIGKMMEVYVDNMLVKSIVAGDHVDHLGQMYKILRKYQMKLNPLKCAFGVGSGKVPWLHGQSARDGSQPREDKSVLGNEFAKET